MVVNSNTDVIFLSGVPFDSSYAHTRWFDNKVEQETYFKSFSSITRTLNNFQKIVGKNYIDVSEHVHTMMKHNYLMFKNVNYQNKWFYCFIVNVQALNSNVTRVYFEVDVIQTWRFDVSFKQSFIAREHENKGNNYNVIPEGLAVGNEYVTIAEYDVKAQPFYWLVVCVKERFDLDYESQLYDGTFYGSPNTLSYYIVPVPYVVDGAGPIQSGRIKWGDNYYTIDIGNVRKLFHELRGNSKAPNNIVSMFITDYLPIGVAELDSQTWELDDAVHVVLNATDKIDCFCVSESLQQNKLKSKTVANVFNVINEQEDKLRYYPYTIIEMSDGRGNVVNFKPEGLRSTNGEINVTFMGAIYFYNWVAYSLNGYNVADNSTRSDLLEKALINSDPQDIAVLDDKTTAYLQGAKNSLEAQKRTLETNLSYNQNSNIIRGVSHGANMLDKGMKAGASAAMATATGSIVSGGVGFGDFIDDSAGVAQSVLNYKKAGADYQNQVNQMNAMLEDISNQPPTLLKQGSNGNAGAGNNQLGVRIKIKRAREEYLSNARSYFHAFGYKSNKFKVPNLHTRQHFNYVQTVGCNIQCNFYNDDIQQIKQIFDRGITLWHTNDLYNYNVTNGVI